MPADLPADRQANTQFAPTLRQLRHYSLTGKIRTTDKREAERLLNAMNESHREPTLNLNLARAYLAAHDPRMAQRTWQAVMDEMATHGIPSTQARCARGVSQQGIQSDPR
jgi:hypothetical protein